MNWLIELIPVVAPSAGQVILRVWDKLSAMKDDEVYRALVILFMAQVIEQNSVINKKLDQANEALAVLLKRTEK